MRISVQFLVALDQLIARFSNAPRAAQVAANRVMNDVGQYLVMRVRENLSGKILQPRTGELRAGVQYELLENAAGVTARVFVDDYVKYARILETGGQTSPHNIVAVRAKALRFLMSGNYVFAYGVIPHPGSKIPAFGYMRNVLMTERTNVNRMIRQGMKDMFQ